MQINRSKPYYWRKQIYFAQAYIRYSVFTVLFQVQMNQGICQVIEVLESNQMGKVIHAILQGKLIIN